MIHAAQWCEKSAIINTSLSATRYKEQANLIHTKQRNGTFCFLNGNSTRWVFHTIPCHISLQQGFKSCSLHSCHQCCKTSQASLAVLRHFCQKYEKQRDRTSIGTSNCQVTFEKYALLSGCKCDLHVLAD